MFGISGDEEVGDQCNGDSSRLVQAGDARVVAGESRDFAGDARVDGVPIVAGVAGVDASTASTARGAFKRLLFSSKRR